MVWVTHPSSYYIYTSVNPKRQPNLLKFSGLVYEAGEEEAARAKVEDKARVLPLVELKKACDLLGACVLPF
jgi:hypothetical protein